MMPKFRPCVPSAASLSGLHARAYHCAMPLPCGHVCALFAREAYPYTPPNLQRPQRGLWIGLYPSHAENQYNMLVLPDKACNRSGMVCIGLWLSDRSTLCVALVFCPWSDFGKNLYACVCAYMCVRVCVSSIILGFFCVIADQKNNDSICFVIQSLIVIIFCRPNADHYGQAKAVRNGN